MKMKVVFFCSALTTLSLTAFGLIDWSAPTNSMIEGESNNLINGDKQNKKIVSKKKTIDLFFDIGSRFRGVKKKTLDDASSILDFLPNEETDAVVSYKTVSVIIIKNDKQTNVRATSTSDVLTEEQLDILQSSDYSTNFLIRADYKGRNLESGKIADYYFSPHLTIVPEKQTYYKKGRAVLLNYLRENTPKLTSGKLLPAKLYFTITKEGKVSSIRLDRSSGNFILDGEMIKLISKIPGEWTPAENYKGETVNQELVLSFGAEGC